MLSPIRWSEPTETRASGDAFLMYLCKYLKPIVKAEDVLHI